MHLPVLESGSFNISRITIEEINIIIEDVYGRAVRETIGVLGYQMERASLGLFNIICNVIVSVISVILLPGEIKIAGLGIGSSRAALLEFVGGLAVLKY